MTKDKAIETLRDALSSMLNVEGCALSGRYLSLTYKGLDVRYHFEKARKALQATKGMVKDI